MKTHRNHRPQPITARLRVRVSRRAVVQAAGMFAIAGTLLISPARPARAGGVTPLPPAVPAGVLTLYSLTFESLQCVAVDFPLAFSEGFSFIRASFIAHFRLVGGL